MTNYRNGAAFERRVQADLERDGYDVVRSAGSHGIADLVAMKSGEWLLVQCKRTSPQLSPRERLALWNLSWRADARPIVASMPGRTGIVYRRLTGPGPKDWQPWTADATEKAS